MTAVVEPSLANELQRRRESLRNGYIPPDTLVVDPSLRFHEGTDTALDPVTYEVIRSKLWNLNVDHSDTIRRVSGSNIVVEGYDFNCAVTTEIGDAVTFSPYSMFFAGFADEIIKWTLEHRSMNVGIRDGDLFLQDDPWVGSNHQMDTAVFGPVFVEGQLFAWLFNCVHQREIGGSLPGGFIQTATDVYTEPTFMPPVKLAEGGVIREDIVDVWTRRSRLPELMALELNSQVAGFNTARKRMTELLQRYGPGAVKATMYKMIDDTARVVGTRLASLPDAEWRDERYIAGVNPGDLRLFRMCLSFDKRGERLRVSNAGTDAAVGAVNIAPGVYRAAVLNALLPILAYDQFLCAAGVLRQLDFEYEPGAITTASHPSAVSTSLGSVATINHAHGLAAKMVSGAPDLAGHAFASSGLHTMSTGSPMWVDASGQLTGDAILDMLSGGIGAFNHRDGMDHGGSILAVAHHFSDVEKFEQSVPFLYLYRREIPHSGGHGRWRGGVVYAAGWTGHKVEQMWMGATGWVKSVTGGIGICGGLPATGGYHWHATDTALRAGFAEGRIPGGPAELRAMAPHGGFAELKMDNRLGPDDVFELFPNPGAGWGDPLSREPRLVAADLDDARLRPNEAEAIYGVVIDGSGAVDAGATDQRRAQIRAQRIAASRAPRHAVEGQAPIGPEVARIIESVAIVEGPAGRCFACAACGQLLGGPERTYRFGCRELDAELSSISELYRSPADETGHALIMRCYVCPGCGGLLDVGVCRPEDTPFDDVRLATG